MVSACARRSQVAYAHARGVSLRSACRLMSVARSTLNYQSRLAAKDAPVLRHMHELSGQYPRFGYRRIQVFLDRLGYPMSADRTHRLCGAVPACKCRESCTRRRVAASRPHPLAPTGSGQMWAYDFVFDMCANGQQLKCLR